MPSHVPFVRSDYLFKYLDMEELQSRIEAAVKLMEKINCEAIAFRGMSGALVAPALALRTDRSLIMVRKPNDSSHSVYKVEGDKAASRYVIVDDFVESGNTVAAILRAVHEFNPEAKCVGVLQMGKITFAEDDDEMFRPFRTIESFEHTAIVEALEDCKDETPDTNAA